MIISEYAKFLQEHNEELITRRTTPLNLLHIWLRSVIYKTPKNHIDKIVHKEILYCENVNGDYVIIGKSDSGRVLVKALIEFAKSYGNYTHSKWMEITEKSFHQSRESD